MDRQILHVDLNNFYASVECLYNPKIRDLPVAVVGDIEARHGIVLAKNQIAKLLGITTGEAIWQAKQKAPNLITVGANFSLYMKFSKLTKSIFSDYTDQTESFGIDESWLDVTGSTRLFGSGEQIANNIRERIHRELGITASVGVSFNKIFAKLGSDMKKPNATTVITKENFKTKVWDLPVSDLLYVGRSTTRTLHRYGICTIGDLANTNTEFLKQKLGKWGVVLHRFANGQDDAPVSKNGETSFVKSVGNSMTSPRDLETVEDVKTVLYLLANSVSARLRGHGLKCTTIQISIRDKNLSSCERQDKLVVPTFLSSEIAKKSLEVFLKKYEFKVPIRSIGVRGTNLVPENGSQQLGLFADVQKTDKLEQLENTVDALRNRFGYSTIQNGLLLTDPALIGLNPKDDHVIHPVNYFDGSIPK